MLSRSLLIVLVAGTAAHTAAVAPRSRAEEPAAWPKGAVWPAWTKPGSKETRVEAVTAEEAGKWLRWVLPLPKRVRLEGKLVLPAAELSFRLRRKATDVEQAALTELETFVAKRTGAKQSGGGFRILIGVCDDDGKIDGTAVPGAEELPRVKNADQAYVIAPLARPGLAVAALSERGVYHGVKTLQQLLEPHLVAGKVTVPIVAILDWPDLAERGQWGGSATRDVQYLADRKMNLIEAHSRLSLDEAGRGVAAIDAERQDAARLHAVKWVPIITHLDQLARTGLYKHYPQLQGKGPKARGYRSSIIAPCFSQPKMAEILAEWFVSLATTKGVADICVWLSEHHVHCGCAKCKASGQYALEAKACVRAWQLARKKRPHVRLRILLTQGSYSTNDKVLAAAAPPEVGITYYDGGRTYNSSRDPLVYPLLAGFAAKGRWLGCYPQLTASWRIVCPWPGPQFMRFRMNEFVDKGLQCLCGYATPDNRFYDFNVTAAAEWSWNARGRSERELSLAWATRRRLADPEKAADWAVMLGPVGWDVYGSGIPYPQFFGRAAAMVRGRRKPELGKGMFRYFPTARHTEDRLAACDRAMKLAEALKDPAILAETRTLRGYVRMVKGIYTVASIVAGKKKLPAAEAQRLQAAFDELTRAETDVTEGLAAWRQAVASDSRASRFFDTVNVTHTTVTAIAGALAPFGVRDSGKPYRPHKIGTWRTSDFDKAEAVRKRWDVTGSIDGAGTYRVRFAYTRGWHGLGIRRAALAAGTQGDALAEVAVDRHNGVAANTNKANTYLLKLRRHDPKARYFLVADIRGTASKGKPPDRQGCEGDVWMVKER